jgi:hypothetical protein
MRLQNIETGEGPKAAPEAAVKRQHGSPNDEGAEISEMIEFCYE